MRLVALLGGVWLVLLAALFIAPWLLKRDYGDDVIRNTVRLSLLCYALAVVLMSRLRTDDWRATTPRGAATRIAWSLAWLAFLIHLVVSMHFFHHWSHEHVLEHTRQASGIGEGVYVSHLFTLLWTLDVLWWWVHAQSFARRSPWIDCWLHGFMAFIIFCGTVVYEQGFIRWAGLVMFAILAAAWGYRFANRWHSRQPALSPDSDTPR